MLKNPFKTLKDNDLEKSLLRLATTERDVNADIILHLIVVKERKLYAPAGYDSLFSYCTGKLGFSKGSAARRKAVVDKAVEFPQLLDRLRDGRLHLCAAAVVAPHLEQGAADQLLDAIVGLSHREVETFLVKQWRAAPAPVAATGGAEAAPAMFDAAPIMRNRSNVGPAQPALFNTEPTPAPKPILEPRTVVRPISPEKSRVSVTLSDKAVENLRRAKEILGNTADGDVIEKALENLLDAIAPERRHARRQKRAAHAPKAQKPPMTNAAPPSRRGTQADRDMVTAESDGRCTFTTDDGKRCGARTYIEIDHIKPWALGGQSTADNFRPLCRTHNAYRAEQTFGRWPHSGSA